MVKEIDIVIDLETLGTKPGCVILEIGACAVDPDTGRIAANFSRRLDEVFVRQDDEATPDLERAIDWWHGPETVATYYTLIRRGLPGMFPRWGNRDPRVDLREFCAWFKTRTAGHDPEGVRVWANGPAFDISILCAAFDRYGVERPWICWQERCARTALEQAAYERGSVSWIERGPRHRAVNDARHEARKLFYSGALGTTSMVMRRLRERGTVSAACNPLNPQARVDLRPISPTMRRVFVPQSERACICAFGKRLASAKPKMIEEIENV